MLDSTDTAGPRHAALAALDTLRRLGLSASPRHLAVFFAYHAGTAPMLRARLDRILAEGAPVPPALLDELHASFVAAPSADPVAPLAAAAGELLDIAHHAGGQVERFEGLLSDAAGRIEALDGPDLRRLAAGLLTLTTQLAQQSAEVAGKLNESERKLLDLRRRIGDVDRAAHTDALTGLGNRRAFEEDLFTLLRERRLGGKPFAIALLRLDQYRRLAETFGQAVADAVLRAAAGHLLGALRATDRPARFGTDEVVVLLPGAGLDSALRLAERVRATIAGQDYVVRPSNERLGAVTLSVGVAIHRADEPAERLVGRADEALQVAIGAGGNRAVPAPEE